MEPRPARPTLPPPGLGALAPNGGVIVSVSGPKWGIVEMPHGSRHVRDVADIVCLEVIRRRGRGPGPPEALPEGASLVLRDDEREDVLARLRPTKVIAGILDGMIEDGTIELDEESHPVDAGVVIDGARWGWFGTLDGWRLLPLDFQDRATRVVRVRAHQTQSMTGAVVEATCTTHTGAVLTSLRDDEEGVVSLDVDYGADAGDAAERILSDIFGDEPICPDPTEHGWQVSTTFAPNISVPLLERLLGALYRPCGKNADHDWMRVHGLHFRWVDGRWFRTELRRTAVPKR